MSVIKNHRSSEDCFYIAFLTKEKVKESKDSLLRKSIQPQVFMNGDKLSKMFQNIRHQKKWEKITIPFYFIEYERCY